jgi:glutathione peroxidase
MKTFIIVAVLSVIAIAIYAFRSTKKHPAVLFSENETSFYDLTYVSLEGKSIQMSDYKGKYVLCVNVASKCGYTYQYEELQQLQDQYKENLVVIGFPCNQFLSQEPGTAEEIREFCTKNYGVQFPLSEKLDVKGTKQHPVYQWLTSKQLNGVSDDEVKWNFHKYLISPNGKWLQAFSSKVKPLSSDITSLIK